MNQKSSLFIIIFLLQTIFNSELYSKQNVIDKYLSAHEIKLAAKISSSASELKNDYPVLPAEPVNSEKFVFIADNASGLIYKYDNDAVLIDKFPYAPDLIKQLDVSFSDYSAHKYYFKESQPFNILVTLSGNNTLLVKDDKFQDKVRELDFSGNLLNFYPISNTQFKKKYLPTTVLQKLKEKYSPDIMSRIEKIYYDGTNLYLSGGKTDIIRIYNPGFSNYTDLFAADLIKQFNISPKIKEYLESPMLYLGYDNELYSIKQGIVKKQYGQDKTELSDINSEDLKFIGVDKDGAKFYWSSLETDLFDNSNPENFVPVIKMFSKTGVLEKIIKNDLWTQYYEKYNTAKKHCDYDGNIYFLTYYTIEKFRIDGTFISEIVSSNDNIIPELIYIHQKYIFVYDKHASEIFIFHNNNFNNFFKYPVTDNNFYISSFDYFQENLYCAGFLKHTKLAKKYKISSVIIRGGGYRIDDIYFSSYPIEKIKVSPSGNLIALTETIDKSTRRIKIVDINGLNSYILYSTKNSLSNIFWIDGNTLCFLEDNKNIIISSSIKNKNKVIYSVKNKIIKSIYPISETQIYMLTDSEINTNQNSNFFSQNQLQPKTQESNESQKTTGFHEFRKNSEPAEINFYTGINENNLVKSIADINKFDSAGDSISEKYNKQNGYLYQLTYPQNLSSSKIDSMPINNFYVNYIKAISSSEVPDLYFDNFQGFFYSIKNGNILEWFYDNKNTVPFLKGGYSYIDPLITEDQLFCIHRYGENSTLYKYIFENYFDNSSFVSGSFKLKNSADKFASESFITTNISDNIGNINEKGEFTLLNPLPGYQELWLISKNHYMPVSISKYIGFNASVKFENIPSIQKNFTNYNKASSLIKSRDYSASEKLLIEFINELDDSDTQLKNAGRKKLLYLYYKLGKYKEICELSQIIGINELNNTYKIMVVNSHIESGNYKDAYNILNTITDKDSKYIDFIEFQKIKLSNYINGKSFISNAKQLLTGRFKNSNPIAFNLIFRDIMKGINLFGE
ncbi:hypothetical protein KA977_08110 [Candidatus Dependentiae bacterium]|nr:hypothetical protein [Candidatus Dependentiae bacterium]